MEEKASLRTHQKREGNGMSDKKCEFLNKEFGKGAYICLWEMKPIGDDKQCGTCKNNTEKENENE